MFIIVCFSLRSKRRYSASAALVAPPTACLGVWAGRTLGRERVPLDCLLCIAAARAREGRDSTASERHIGLRRASLPTYELVCPYRLGGTRRLPVLVNCVLSLDFYLCVFMGPRAPAP